MAIKKFKVENQEYLMKTAQSNSQKIFIDLNGKKIDTKVIKRFADQTIIFEVNNIAYKAKLIEKNASGISIFIFNFNKTLKIDFANSQPIKITPSQNLINNPTYEKKFENQLTSPLAGKIIKIYIKENDFVKKNQPLLIIESMKMENEIRAEFDVFIKNIQIRQSDLVQQDQLLMIFEKKGEFYAKTKISDEQEEI